jgi:hypothetical protein
MTKAVSTLSWGFKVEELDALDAAAGGADGFGVDADDLAELADGQELAGLDEGMPVDLCRPWGWSSRPNSQNGNPSKINPEKVACFSSPKTDRQLPSFHQQSTTTSPPKKHVLPPVFCQNPQQKRSPTTPKKLLESIPENGS